MGLSKTLRQFKGALFIRGKLIKENKGKDNSGRANEFLYRGKVLNLGNLNS